MNLELIEVMRQIERSRKVERHVLIEAIEAALISASRKNYGAAQDIRVDFNEGSGDLIAFVRKEVVEEVIEPWHQLSLDDARRSNPGIKAGDVVEEAMSPSDFGRIAAQTAKQVVLQRVRESERNANYEEYKTRLGELINGSVIRIEHKNVIVDLGETEALLPAREQAPKEYYQSGDRIKAFILDVRRSNRAPQVILSRTHPGLIKKLFEMEVPEVSEGVVEIKGVARESGSRSKVMVYSADKNVDPVGACVGIKGSRIQSIVREIRGEKIDVIPYSEDVTTMLKSALQPAKILTVGLNSEKKQASVIVKEDQLSLAIGKNGQNVRLASKLTGWKIDIVSDTQNQELMRRKAEEAFMQTAPALEKIKGISEKNAATLKEAGYANVIALRNVTAEMLSELPGIGLKTAEKIINAISDYMPAEEVPKVEHTAEALFAKLGGDDEKKPETEKEVQASDLFSGLDKLDNANTQAESDFDGQTTEKRDDDEDPAEQSEPGEEGEH